MAEPEAAPAPDAEAAPMEEAEAAPAPETEAAPTTKPETDLSADTEFAPVTEDNAPAEEPPMSAVPEAPVEDAAPASEEEK